MGRVGIDDFTPPSGSVGQIGREGGKIMELVVDSRGEVEAVGGFCLRGVSEDGLQLGEEAAAPGESEGHTAELPQETLPFAAGGSALVGGKGVKKEAEAINTVGR